MVPTDLDRSYRKMAYIFPGQGSQFVGMGLDLYMASASAREVFDEADMALSFPLSKLMFQGPESELEKTINAQPAILIASLATLAVIKDCLEPFDPKPLAYAGHSLGEYTALIASGALSFAKGVLLVKERGRVMQAATEKNDGAMAAIIGLDSSSVAGICRDSQVEIANINTASQIVISGRRQSVNTAIELAKSRGARKAIPLPVSGAFHSELMAPAQIGLNAALRSSQIDNPRSAVIGNLSGQPLNTQSQVRDELEKQLCGCVDWVKSVETMVDMGANTFVEIGPGNVLTGLVKRINKDVNLVNVSDAADARKFAGENITSIRT